MSDDLRLPRSFPSAVEYIGVVAATVPFVFSASSVSSRTENGRVVELVVRDWLAIGGGSIAVLAGLISLAFVARTERTKRVIRVIAGLVLVAAGTFAILKGVGVVGQGAASTRTGTTKLTITPVEVADARTSIDAMAISKQFFARWRADQLDQLVKEMQLESTRGMERVFEIFDPAFGSFQSVKDAAVVETTGDPRIDGHAVFEHATVAFHLEVVTSPSGVSHVGGFKVTPPDDLIAKLEKTATPASADLLARTVLGILLTGKIIDAFPQFEHALIDNLPKDFDSSLSDILAEIGPTPKVTLAKQDACAGKKQEVPIMRCFEYKLVTTKGKSVVTVDLGWRLSRWYVFAFNLTPP
ncbi:MAG: hypothetical protein WKG01_16225 [Kofleriaceae bacterium]